MKIASVQYQLPSRVVTNADILDAVMEHSKPTFEGDLAVLRHSLSKLFDLTGSRERRILADGEKPIQLLRQAVERALDESGWKPSDVELVIYVGIGKGFIEPANATATAQALGMNNANCFDVVDACMSWMRGANIADLMIRSQQYSKIMIINEEFNHTLYGYPDLLQYSSMKEIEYRFAGLTIGEAASVTCVAGDGEPSSWNFTFKSRPDLADLCTIPNSSYELFYDYPSDRVGRNGAYNFTSYGKDLHDKGLPEMLNTIDQSGLVRDDIAAVVTHSSSSRFWHGVADKYNLADRFIDIFPTTGNVVSASVPVSLAVAEETGRLKRGDRVIGFIGSAGMSYCCFSFDY